MQGIAVSSYQGGHVEYFKYMVDLLRERGGAHIKVFGGGGGVIVPDEIAELQAYGVTRIFSPEDGQRLGLHGMIRSMIRGVRRRSVGTMRRRSWTSCCTARSRQHRPLAQLITALENGRVEPGLKTALHKAADGAKVPVLGITGTGGAGKSSLTDELIRRFRLDQGDELRHRRHLRSTRRGASPAARCSATASA